MIIENDLTPEERDILTTLEARFSTRARFPITLDKLLSSWQDFVADVEDGYGSTIDEYTNDVSTRDLLQEVLQTAPDSLRHKLLARLRPTDERFERATRPDDKHRIDEFIHPGTGWWWSRVPVKVTGALAMALHLTD